MVFNMDFNQALCQTYNMGKRSSLFKQGFPCTKPDLKPRFIYFI